MCCVPTELVGSVEVGRKSGVIRIYLLMTGKNWQQLLATGNNCQQATRLLSADPLTTGNN